MRRRLTMMFGVILSVIGVMASSASFAFAAGSQGSSVGAVIISPGGGIATDGSDGIRLVLNGLNPLASSIGSDQLRFANTLQWCCGGTSPMINVGGQLFGEAGAAQSTNATSWSSVQLVSQSGAVEVLAPGSSNVTSSATGNASVLLRYQAVRNGLTYIVDRQVVYTFPNNFYTENYTFTIPSGNTEVVKFYQGGDAAPGSSDVGRGFSVSVPNVAAYEVNPSSGIYVSYQEVNNGGAFDGLWAARYNSPYSTIAAGGDIGFVTDTNTHDAGLDMQWTLGSSPGVFQRSMISQAGFQAVQVTGSFASSEATSQQPVNFVVQVVNTDFAAKSGLAFSGALPSGLSIAGSFSTTCSATISAAQGTTSFSFAAGSLGAASNCTLTIPVVGPTGTYSWSDQDFVVTAPLQKGFATSQLVYSVAPGPAPTPAPEPEIANTGSAAAWTFTLLGLALVAFGGLIIAQSRRAR